LTSLTYDRQPEEENKPAVPSSFLLYTGLFGVFFEPFFPGQVSLFSHFYYGLAVLPDDWWIKDVL